MCVCVRLVSAVHVVLVTDLLVLLTERDQKYHLATLQDLKVGGSVRERKGGREGEERERERDPE